MIENVGNLVCPAEFRVGEDARIMVSSVTEGEDKPLKYPLMFRTCELVLVNKIDLLPHLDFDMEQFLHHLDAVHPGVPRHARERAHRRGRRGVPRLAAGAARRREVAGLMEARRRRPAPRGQRLVVRGRGGAAGAAVREMAERFARGGRLLATGDVSDARHVAVEFVHPVIVGKRALPALAVTARELELLAEPDDMVIAFGVELPDDAGAA